MSRIASVVALFAVFVAGCGGAARSPQPVRHGLPRALARGWEVQASEIAAAATAGDDCRAMHLAHTLRDEVVASKSTVPRRLQAALLTGVTALADRTTCTPPPAPTKPPKQSQPPKGPGPADHGHKGHHGHHGKGKGK
ncbi:MAG TPA: hypothetical protein VJP41_12820 [Gaiellaceae bacterium]|nr:hypothetical protein [Gaiellaceae bacterium]